MKRTWRTFALLALAAFMLLLSACGSNTTTEVSEASVSTGAGGAGKNVFIGIVNPPTSFNPINIKGTADQQVIAIMNDTLLGVDDTFNFVPRLAQSVETEDNKTFTVKLQENAKWSDGEPFTAKDVEFTLLMAANPAVTATINLSYIEGLNNVGKLEEGQTSVSGFHVIDDHTFEIATKNPVDLTFFNDNFSAAMRFLPQHVLKDVNPAELEKNEYMMNPTVTAGAFKFVKFAKDQYVEYAANPDYYLGAPKVDKIFVKIMPASNLVAQLQSGEIDMNMIRTGLVPSEDYEKVSNLNNVTAKVGDYSSAQTVLINNGVITDPRVRQAFVLATNRQQLVDQLLKGNGEVYEGLMPTNHPYFNKDLVTRPYDPVKAKQLLQEAGWDFSMPINFVVPTGNKVREQASELMAANLKEVGLNIQIQKFDFPTAFQKVKDHDYDISVISLPYSVDPSLVYNGFRPGAPNDYANYADPSLGELLAKGIAEMDAEKRKQIYNEIQKKFYDETIAFTLMAENPMVVTSKAMKVGESKFDMLLETHLWEKE
jgi:peptide/nickel transport system substrate-binding protein